MNAKELGKLMGCAETGLDYKKIYSFEGANDAYEKSASYVNSSIEVLEATRKIFDAAGVPEDSDVYRLVKSAIFKGRRGEWNDTCDKVAAGVYDFSRRVGHVKHAAAIGPLMALGGKGILLLSAVTGIGLGTLYWALKKNSQEEALPNEKLKMRIDQYHNMARDLEDSIEQKTQTVDEI